MLHKPQLKKCYQLANVGADGIVLLTEQQSFWLSGRPFIKIGPYLTGKYTTDEIIEELTNELSMPEVFYALSVLEQQGYIVEADHTLPDAQLAYWHALGIGAATVRKQLASWQVELLNFCDAAVGEAATRGLQEAGITVQEGGNFRLVLVPDYDLPELEQLNKDCLVAGIPWLLVKPTGTQAWIGPLFQPGESACWACLAQRITANRQMESYVKLLNNHQGSLLTSTAALPATIQVAVGMALVQLGRWLVAPAPRANRVAAQ